MFLMFFYSKINVFNIYGVSWPELGFLVIRRYQFAGVFDA